MSLRKEQYAERLADIFLSLIKGCLDEDEDPSQCWSVAIDEAAGTVTVRCNDPFFPDIEHHWWSFIHQLGPPTSVIAKPFPGEDGTTIPPYEGRIELGRYQLLVGPNQSTFGLRETAEMVFRPGPKRLRRKKQC